MSPSKVRHKTSYHGIYFTESTKKVRNKQEKIYYTYYYKDGKQYEESVGRQYRDDMTPARASVIRSSRINGNTLPNSEKRRKRSPERKPLNYLWDIYQERNNITEGCGTAGTVNSHGRPNGVFADIVHSFLSMPGHHRIL